MIYSVNLILSLALFGFALSVPSGKISAKLRSTLVARSSTNVFISMQKGTSDVLSSLISTNFENRVDRLNAVASALRNLRDHSQKTVLGFLEKNKIEHTSFWIDNSIFIRNANLELVKKLATFNEIDEIYEEHVFDLEEPEISEGTPVPRALQWGVEKIGADRVWALAGNTNGSGIVVGTIDTGVRYTHQDLRENYRSDYGWFDPTSLSEFPNDSNGHGTHTMGTIIGANGIGVAPGAQWIACKGCTIPCSQFDFVACGQFMTCPTDFQGNDPDCSKAPHLVSNSWGTTQEHQNWFHDIAYGWVAAGIVPLFSIGNTGPDCATVNYPGYLDPVIGVGSTTIMDEITSWSSRGPTTRGTPSPDVTAPGSSIYSAYHTSDTAYQTMSGSSMSAPHAAGAVALILGVRPNATVAQVKEILFNHASHDVVPTGEICGGISDNQFPNNVFGSGRVDVYSSVLSLLDQK